MRLDAGCVPMLMIYLGSVTATFAVGMTAAGRMQSLTAAVLFVGGCLTLSLAGLWRTVEQWRRGRHG